jgi:hypothetical protein
MNLAFNMLANAVADLVGAVIAATNAQRYDASRECGFFMPEAR